MAETRPDQPSADQKPNNPNDEKRIRITFERVISFLNLIVLAVTMGGVFWYAGEARKQNILIGAEGRPAVYGNGVSVLERTPDGIPSKVTIKFRNFGKSMATAVETGGHIFLEDPGKPAPVEPACKGGLFELPKSTGGTAISPDAYIEPELVPILGLGEDLSDVNSGKVLYVVGCVYYLGLDRTETYYSDLCVIWAPKAPQDFQLCKDPNRNYAR